MLLAACSPLLAFLLDHPAPGDLQLARIVCRRIAESYDADTRQTTIPDQARNDDLRLLTLE